VREVNEFQELIMGCREMAHKGVIGVIMAMLVAMIGPMMLVVMTSKDGNNG
jgi:hypothetical protein